MFAPIVLIGVDWELISKRRKRRIELEEIYLGFLLSKPKPTSTSEAEDVLEKHGRKNWDHLTDDQAEEVLRLYRKADHLIAEDGMDFETALKAASIVQGNKSSN